MAINHAFKIALPPTDPDANTVFLDGFLDDVAQQLVIKDHNSVVLFTIGGVTGIGGGGTLNMIPIFSPDGTHIANSIVTQSADQLFINRTVADNGSNAGVQYSSLVSNRAQIRESQYGNNAGIPGISTLKSRGAALGTLTPVQVGDAIFGVTAVGVTDNGFIPLSGLIQIVVSAVPAGQGYIGTDLTLQLVSKNGPVNGRRKVLKVDSEGVVHLFEATVVAGQPQSGCAGLVILDGGGNATILNANVSATSRFNLTFQDGGAVPTSVAYAASRIVGTSFTISSVGGGNAASQIYWQLFEPAP